MQEEIDRLISQLGSSASAVERLLEIGSPALDSLCLALKDADLRVRGNAAEALGRLGDVRAVKPLLQAMKDKSGDVRGRAAEALGRLGDARAVKPLCRALKDYDRYVRRNAAQALGKLGDISAVEPLLKAMSDSDEDRNVRVSATSALGKMRLAAVEPLLQALKDKDSFVRENAASILDKLGTPTSLPRSVLAEKSLTAQERWQALESLRKVHYNDESLTLRYPLPDIRRYCQQLLEDEDEAVREGARSVLDGNNLLRASQRDYSAEPNELLRAATAAESTSSPEELLRASDKDNRKPEAKRHPHGLLARLLKRGK